MLAQLSFQMAQTQVQRLSEARQDPGPAGQIKASPVHAGCDTDSPQDRLSARFLHLASWFLGQLFIMTDFQPVAIVSQCSHCGQRPLSLPTRTCYQDMETQVHLQPNSATSPAPNQLQDPKTTWRGQHRPLQSTRWHSSPVPFSTTPRC